MKQQQNNSSQTRSLNFARTVFKRLRIFFGFDLPDKFQLYYGPRSDLMMNFELAFTLAGKSYYWTPDQTEMPTARGLAALAIYEEMRMGVTKEYIEKHCEEVDKILSKTRPSIQELGRLVTLHDNLRDRSKLMILPDYIFKLASVVFVERDESPFTYDWKLNNEKIRLFKQHGDVAFFLTTPLKNLLPHLTLPEKDSQKYLNLNEQIDQMHWAFLNSITELESKN